MVRISKQQERRMRSPKKRKSPSKKTGSKKDLLPLGYKAHENAADHLTSMVFIPKIG
jgi:hypothetical protein